MAPKGQTAVPFAINDGAKITKTAQIANGDEQLAVVVQTPQQRKLDIPFIVDTATHFNNEQRLKIAKSVQQFLHANNGQQLETFTTQPAENSECRAATINFDKYRVPYEAEDHWDLRRCFLEKNYQSIPEDELTGLAQLFMNIELLHCRYPPETMARVEQLSAGVSEECQRNRRYVPLARTFVASSEAFACGVQKTLQAPDLNSLCNGAPGLGNNTLNEPEPYKPIPCPKTLDEILHNIIVIHNSYHETAREFERLNCGSKFDCNISCVDVSKYVACVKVGTFVIAQVEQNDEDRKTLLMRIHGAAIKYLTQRCYSLLKKKITEWDGISVISKSTTKDQPPDTGKEEKKSDVPLGQLDNSNIGFKIMLKLGWTGGPLGPRGDGIINPVEAIVKKGRKGLGHANPVQSTKMNNIKYQLKALRSGVVDYLVFSAAITKNERSQIHVMAKQFGLSTRNVGVKKNRQLVVEVAPLSAFEKLNKVLIEKDPFYCKMFEVRPPRQLISLK